jgi:hypothetical protein
VKSYYELEKLKENFDAKNKIDNNY